MHSLSPPSPDDDLLHAQTSPGGASDTPRMDDPLKPILIPLSISPNRWQAHSIHESPSDIGVQSREVIERKVKGLLNKLTMKNFDTISGQIVGLITEGECDKGARVLVVVVELVLEKATDGTIWTEVYARLCRNIMEQISPNIHDDASRNSEGKLVTGDNLFNKYLLDRCQDTFERAWTTRGAMKPRTKEPVVKAHQAIKGGEDKCSVHHAVQDARRPGRRPGYAQFIGELFKLQMLTERILHECVIMLLRDAENLEEGAVESLCMLMTIAGSLLDAPKARTLSLSAAAPSESLVFDNLFTSSRSASAIIAILDDIDNDEASNPPPPLSARDHPAHALRRLRPSPLRPGEDLCSSPVLDRSRPHLRSCNWVGVVGTWQMLGR